MEFRARQANDYELTWCVSVPFFFYSSHSSFVEIYINRLFAFVFTWIVNRMKMSVAGVTLRRVTFNFIVCSALFYFVFFFGLQKSIKHKKVVEKTKRYDNYYCIKKSRILHAFFLCFFSCLFTKVCIFRMFLSFAFTRVCFLLHFCFFVCGLHLQDHRKTIRYIEVKNS